MAFEPVAFLAVLSEGELYPCEIGGTSVFVVRLGERVVAYEDACPHAGVLLSEGTLRGRVLTCSRHEWQFDVASGSGIQRTLACLTSFAVEVRAGQVFVDVKRPGH